MEIKRLLARLRWFTFRQWALYVLVFIVVIMCVDISAVVQSVKIRQLNDMVTGVNMSQLFAFSKGEIPASAVNWKVLTAYFRTIMKFFPTQEDAEMFLGYCEYYGLGQQENAYVHIRRSADNMPYLFWNLYDTGIFLFKKGDLDHAVSYFEMALLLRTDKMLYTMGNSIIYRQFFPEALNPDVMVRLNHARERAFLLLTAAYYSKQNYDMAKIFDSKGMTEEGITDREPFYFYAGAMAMARGNTDEALIFFDKAIKAKSKNPLVYQYAEDILKKLGRNQEAQKKSQMKQSFGNKLEPNQFPYPKYLRLEFY